MSNISENDMILIAAAAAVVIFFKPLSNVAGKANDIVNIGTAPLAPLTPAFWDSYMSKSDYNSSNLWTRFSTNVQALGSAFKGWFQ